MSLVSEALRKARQQAAERGEKQRGVSFRTTVVLGGGRAARGPGLFVALVVVAAALLGAAVAWVALSPRGPARAPGSSVARTDASAVAPAGPATVPASPARGEQAARRAQEAAPRSAPVPPPPAAGAPEVPAIAAATPTAPATAPTPAEPEAAAPDVNAAGQPRAAEPRHALVPPYPNRSGTVAATEDEEAAPPAAAAAPPPLAKPAGRTSAGREAGEGPGGEHVYVLEADLGKTKLHLDFLVYRAKDPFAQINGQQIVIGSVLEGYTVQEISPEFVRLTGPAGGVVIRTH